MDKIFSLHNSLWNKFSQELSELDLQSSLKIPPHMAAHGNIFDFIFSSCCIAQCATGKGHPWLFLEVRSTRAMSEGLKEPWQLGGQLCNLNILNLYLPHEPSYSLNGFTWEQLFSWFYGDVLSQDDFCLGVAWSEDNLLWLEISVIFLVGYVKRRELLKIS